MSEDDKGPKGFTASEKSIVEASVVTLIQAFTRVFECVEGNDPEGALKVLRMSQEVIDGLTAGVTSVALASSNKTVQELCGCNACKKVMEDRKAAAVRDTGTAN